MNDLYQQHLRDIAKDLTRQEREASYEAHLSDYKRGYAEGIRYAMQQVQAVTR